MAVIKVFSMTLATLAKLARYRASEMLCQVAKVPRWSTDAKARMD